MTDRETRLIFGGLLHDIGKVIYRQGGKRKKHSQSGYEFLKDEMQMEEDDILDCVRYHHADALENAEIADDSLAYIVYIADNIASAADRRKKGSSYGFEMSMPLQSVFNILNRNDDEKYYEPKTLNEKDAINYPIPEKKKFGTDFYTKIKENLAESLKSLEWTQEYIHSLLEVLEANLSYIPSSTAKSEVADVSLFDHLKLTAAAASCILGFLEEQNVTDYKTGLYKKAAKFYKENAFLLFSMDISGIQDFIYTITTKNALKTLRARSFYLEMMMEHITDGLLENLHLSRANLIYSGGGHCYILMPNTKKAKAVTENYMEDLNHWLLETFQISLYVAWGTAPCSTNALKNSPEGSYAQIFQNIGEEISKKKGHRYSAADIRSLNAMTYEDYTRECKVCKKIAKVNEDGICPICSAIERFSKNILYEDFFTVSSKKSSDSLPLPGGYYLTSDNEERLQQKIRQSDSFVRAYSKNKMFTGSSLAAKLWVGSYTDGRTFEEYAQDCDGIGRIGILRADVDNLGQAFVSGFENPDSQDNYVTLSRTATLSRQLSLFFKLHINRILEEGGYSIDGKEPHPRKATICYSGGDDLFIVGAWNEVIELAVDIRRAFARYTQGMLTLSAGIGVYTPGYPISAIAREVAELEDSSKKLPGKNAVTIFPDGQFFSLDGRTVSDGTYSWLDFEQYVLEEKYPHIYRFFETSEERGKNFLYNLLELIRGRTEKINFARYVYILSRLEPDEKAPEAQIAAYKEFSAKMYQWYQGEHGDVDCRHLKTAINLYAYLKRDKEETKDVNQ